MGPLLYSLTVPAVTEGKELCNGFIFKETVMVTKLRCFMKSPFTTQKRAPPTNSFKKSAGRDSKIFRIIKKKLKQR